MQSNDETGKSDSKGTSRFSRWFRQKEAANNNEFPGFRESHAQEKRGMSRFVIIYQRPYSSLCS